MRTQLILAMAMLLPCFTYSQYKGKITGKITDAQNKQPLDGATVSVLDSASGMYVKHAVSNTKGEFTISALPVDTALQVIVSFTGYRDSSAFVRISGKMRSLNLGDWKLVAGDELEVVTVTARKPPFVVKKDTLEFNATAFKSLPTDMVQDLLRKLPGVSIDPDGNVTVNGQKVDKIQVDGRDFFNPNIKTALENLPGAIIDKVQVTPSREKAQANTSLINPTDRNVTINLQLKKQNRKGKFGHFGAGYGTQQLYQADAFLNAFKEGNRYSAVANARRGNDGGYLGQNANWGLNGNTKLNQKTTLDANYQGNLGEREGSNSLERLNILPDSSFLYNNISASKTKNTAHQVHVNLDVDIDTLQKLNIRPEVSYSENTNDQNNTSVSTTVEGKLINSQLNRQISTTRTTGFNNYVAYYKSSRNGRSVFSANWNMRTDQGAGTLRNMSENQFGNNKDTIDQYGNTRSSRMNNMLNFILNQKLFKSFTTIVQYNFMQSSDRNAKNVFNSDNRLDSNFSNDNRNTMMSHLPNVSIGYVGKRLVVELGAGWTFLRQENRIVWKDSSVKISQRNFTPRMSASWTFAQRSSVTMQYSVASNAPAAEQLAPVPDNSNPLAITLGNPFLKSSFTHNMNAALQYYSPDLRWFGNIRGGGSFSDQPIVPDSYFDDSGRQVSTWRNAPSGQNLSLNVTLGRSVRVGEWNWQFTIEGQITNSLDPGFINGALNKVQNVQLNPNIGINMNYGSVLSMNLRTGIESNTTEYTLSGINNIQYDSKRVQWQCNWFAFKKLNISPSVSYYYNAQLPAEFQRAQTLMNVALNYFLLKGNKLAIGVMVNDILNNGVTTVRTVTPTAIETTQVNAVRRYGMFTVRYQFREFGGKM